MDGSKRRLVRLACDRCHRQKLRCSRASTQSRACQRCVKAGERCTYSPPLRLGRPVSSNKAGGQARRSSSDGNGSKSRSSERPEQVSPLTPITTPPAMPHAPPLCLPLGNSAKISMPSSPEDCSNLKTEKDNPFTCLTPLSGPSHFPPVADSHRASMGPADYFMNPTMPSTLHANTNDTFFGGFDNDFRHEAPRDSSIMLGMATTAPTYGLNDMLLYSMYSSFPGTLTDDKPQSGSIIDPERQLLDLQQSFFETSCSPTSVGEVCGLYKKINSTMKAASILLSIMTTVMASGSRHTSPPCSDDAARYAGQGYGTTTILLVTTCYTRILNDINAISSRLYDLVSTGDQEALLSLPCVQLGSFMPTTLVDPAIQTSLLVQLLFQSLREIEKRLPLLAGVVLDRPTSGRAAGGRMHADDVFGHVTSDVANLKAHVMGVLSVTLDLLRHSGNQQGLGQFSVE
ncbi:hypothetical protein HIM_10753 [Hirsutella minnesotensis 3608]|uniref:Zn(2)-C6 fungal-type domain-containing protein n=1 Tax=Hirsutella minnesotensis 3608 TaxID=1043627 RepID=A0A0F7ZRM1_9HYPO|nr:hypothetical protein HIM_10753 [Hirsutella minnesotensis 3608]